MKHSATSIVGRVRQTQVGVDKLRAREEVRQSVGTVFLTDTVSFGYSGSFDLLKESNEYFNVCEIPRHGVSVFLFNVSCHWHHESSLLACEAVNRNLAGTSQ